MLDRRVTKESGSNQLEKEQFVRSVGLILAINVVVLGSSCFIMLSFVSQADCKIGIQGLFYYP